MFAVIKTGGKQYSVKEGDKLVIEKLIGDAGETVTFDTVLMTGEGDAVTIGAPTVEGAFVSAQINEQRKGDKIIIRKKRQRSTYRRTQGHRQLETIVTITGISADGKPVKAKKKAAAKPAPKSEKPAAKADAKPTPKKADTDSRGRLTEAVGTPDDLKLIKGVGKVLETKLNDAGIFHFWQIAGLKSDQIEELEKDMSFPGRITRDNWVEQAEAFATE